MIRLHKSVFVRKPRTFPSVLYLGCNGSFQQPARWKSNTSPNPSIGVFGVEGLHSPHDWARLTNYAIDSCNALRAELRTISSPHDPPSPNSSNRIEIVTSKSLAPQQLALLDGVSNIVCSVIDAAELCRNVHSSEAWRNASESVFTELSSYIAELNTDDQLYRVLAAVNSDENVFASLQEEDRRLAVALKSEFERDGIALPPEQRRKLRELNDTIVALETEFGQNIMRSGGGLVHVPAESVRPLLAPSHWAHVPQTGPLGSVTLPTDPRLCHALIRHCQNPAVRKSVYASLHASASSNLGVLRELVLARDAFARDHLGFESFGHRTLADKMVQDPGEVDVFLRSVAAGLAPAAEAEAKELLSFKAQVEGAEAAAQGLHQWDVPYYTALAKAVLDEEAESAAFEASQHFPLNRCILGLATLCRELFGVNVALRPAPSHETWVERGSSSSLLSSSSPEEEEHMVVKLSLTHPSEGLLGHIYLDLLPREGKYGHSAHFTVRCGCRKPPFSLHSFTLQNQKNQQHQEAPPTVAFTSSPGSEKEEDERGEEYQVPIVALVMNFSGGGSAGTGGGGSSLKSLGRAVGGWVDRQWGSSSSTGSSSGSSRGSQEDEGEEEQDEEEQQAAREAALMHGSRVLLAHSEVETLFHEFGHALHSLLSRTKYQHLSGTRTAADFVETPSQLLEHFVWDPTFVCGVPPPSSSSSSTSSSSSSSPPPPPLPPSFTPLSGHFKSGEPLKPSVLETLSRSKKRYAALDTLNQVLLSLYDQNVFSAATATALHEASAAAAASSSSTSSSTAASSSTSSSSLRSSVSPLLELADELHSHVFPQPLLPPPRTLAHDHGGSDNISTSSTSASSTSTSSGLGGGAAAGAAGAAAGAGAAAAAPWMCRFGHLTTYAATYYGYMYNKAFAAHLWEHLFSGGRCLDQASGEKLWKALLRPGGSRDPLQLLRDALDGNDPELAPFFEEMYQQQEQRSDAISK